MKRRDFLKLGATGLALASQPSLAAMRAFERGDLTSVKNISALNPQHTCPWLGKALWGNRLQDWRQHNGRIECIAEAAELEVRTAALLTRQLNNQHSPARLSMTLGQINPGHTGFAGFLLGIGEGDLEYRAAALAQRYSGTKGGIMAVIDQQGQLSFRDFSDAAQPLNFELIGAPKAITWPEAGAGGVRLECHIDPVAGNQFDLRLIAFNALTGENLGFAVATGIAPERLCGGISILSSPSAYGKNARAGAQVDNKAGARFWFQDIASGGDKITAKDTQGLGPVMGCLYSLNRRVLKLSVQLMPIDLRRNARVQFLYRQQQPAQATQQSAWQQGPISTIEDGYVALMRLDNWRHEDSFDYRIVFPEDKNTALFSGTITRDPEQSKNLNIALYSCIIPTSKSLDDGQFQPFVPQETMPGRYTTDNILFPHTELVRHCDSHQPDLYLFVGDQYYETYPTRYGREGKDAKLDTLYRWYLWYWSFRDSVRHKPCLVLADDHDVLQGNLWGNSGTNSELPKEEDGGFKHDKSLVRMVYRMQHGHNPDSYDDTPIAFDIPVCYGNFVYGGVNFAFVEDRKFKSPPDYQVPLNGKRGELLGERQEAFLRHWKNTEPGLPKVCITASMWGSPQTLEDQKPLVDFDANGFPADGRTRAVQLVKDADALVLSGDQHLGLLAIQGIESFDDGVLFFSGPAAAAFWQRWFEGAGTLANQRNQDPNTGDFIDSFGNKMRVLAVANPKIPFVEFNKGRKGWGMFLADRSLKSEGYGIIKVNHKDKHFDLECWPWEANPAIDPQFPGWPYRHNFPVNKA
ncbi:hypothetical protein R50072_34270 [Simiduia litorea]|uniref:alkaline phosphatase D family protein n=1 Tax=Simiduia litorea TaxID=1435348 RepID=UPI0036F243F4